MRSVNENGSTGNGCSTFILNMEWETDTTVSF